MSTAIKREAEDSPAQLKPKKSKKRKANAPDDELLDTELGLNTLFTKMDNQLLADHLAQKLGRFGTDLSAVEISDMTVSANAIQDTTSWQESRTLDKFPDFLEKVSEDPEGLKKAPKKKGSPHTLIVAGAGLRAADIVRSVRKFQSKENSVAKLFAKHMKVEEQVKFLQNHRTGICVGTPARLMDLIDNGKFGLVPSIPPLSCLLRNRRQALTSVGALSLDNLKRLVVDASHIDQKKRGVMDMKDTMMPLARFLSRKELKDRYGDEKKPLDTSTPECATICSRELMNYHGIPTVEGVCHDMAVQRELFSCLASSCTDQYGQALTYTVSTCSLHGATISDLLPVEIQHTSLTTRHFMPLVSRSDSASFGFENRFSLSVDCKAGSDGILTLSLPESTASAHQSIPGGGFPTSPGAGNGNSNAGAGPPGGAPGPSNGPLPGNTAGSGNGQGSPSGGTGPGGGGGNGGTEPSDPNADCEENNSSNGPSQSGINDGQYPPAPAPVPANPPANSNPQTDGQSNGPPAPGPDAAVGHSSPDDPNQGNTGQPQPQPAPAPSNPDGGDVAPNKDGTGGLGEDCDENAPGNNAAPAPPNTGGSVDCSIDINNPACANQNQLPPGPPGPQPAPQLPAPQIPAPAPDSPAPQGPPPAPAPAGDKPPCGAEDGIPDCPASHQPPNGDGSGGNACSDPNSNAGCGSSEPSSPQSPPQTAPPAVPNSCTGDENSPCHDGGDSGSDPGSRSMPANRPSPNSPDAPPPDVGLSPAAPPFQPNTNSNPDNGASCAGMPGPCPANGGPGIPTPANPPSPASPPSTPPEGQVPNGSQDNDGAGKESPGKGSGNGDGGKGSSDLGPQAPEITVPPAQPVLPAPAVPAQLPGPPAQPRPPQPTGPNAVGGAHEGPQVITPTNGPSMYSSPSQLKERAMADIERRQENGQELDTPGNDIPAQPAPASAASAVQAGLPTESGMPEPSFVVSNDSTRSHDYSRASLTFAVLVVFVAMFSWLLI
ncbi:hypothetical protein FDENT_8681 [Fusarium denticulatum]|uniref:Uncharacterized protein n=1 Tax=Fusarium denticulatum TaxID=48507 RepID=A0A8H5X2Z7_9HYPO|nr:hypothetical protein FDENT_8681 [Fusarium denticulatum]